MAQGHNGKYVRLGGRKLRLLDIPSAGSAVAQFGAIWRNLAPLVRTGLQTSLGRNWQEN